VKTDDVITLGVSACLIGQAVRYDGQDKHHNFIAEVLAEHFVLIPFCPEVAIGLGVPRPAIQLIAGDPFHPRARGVDDPSTDVTDRLQDFAREVTASQPTLSGYIFKSRSPSCGLRDTTVYGAGMEPVATGTGIYAGAILSNVPLLPAIDEDQLMEPAYYESFIYQVTAYHRWLQLQSTGVSTAGLEKFHNDHKLLLKAFGPERNRFLNRLVAGLDETEQQEQEKEYIGYFMQTLQSPLSATDHANVLEHLLDAIKEYVDVESYNGLSEAVAGFKAGDLSLNKPITLMRNELGSRSIQGLQHQVYLNPHPAIGLVSCG
jgi:uncharacterized protein YbbK (DUF523 family)/uncharacterized protein YbgA (DUF1722 family)